MSATGTEARVCALIEERQKLGISKYGTTVEDNPLGMIQWLKHLRDELLDGAIYAQRAIEQLEGVKAESLNLPVIDMTDGDEAIRVARHALKDMPEAEDPLLPKGAMFFGSIPVVTKEEKEALNDPHAELRKTWRKGQVWQGRPLGYVGIWNTYSSGDGPAWYPEWEYRRSPDCTWTDPEQKKPWYPDDSGEWVEVPDDLMEMPGALSGNTIVEVLNACERANKVFTTCKDPASNWFWGRDGDSTIVAYKVIKL